MPRRNVPFLRQPPPASLLSVIKLHPIAITFARPEESRAFRRRLCISKSRGHIGGIEIAVFHTGIGPAAARSAVARILRGGEWWMLVSAGFAGGLDPRLAVGDCIVAEQPDPARRIISRGRPVATVAEKNALHRETGAQAVDMETGVIAEVCAAAGIVNLAIRGVSDDARTALPVPFETWFDAARQCARPAALAAYLLSHPGRIVPFARFLRDIARAGSALALAIEAAIRSLELH